MIINLNCEVELQIGPAAWSFKMIKIRVSRKLQLMLHSGIWEEENNSGNWKQLYKDSIIIISTDAAS